MANEPNKGNMPDQNKGNKPQDQWKGSQSQGGQPNKGGQQGGQQQGQQGGQHQGNKQDQERNR
jgi:hypothetical protein